MAILTVPMAASCKAPNSGAIRIARRPHRWWRIGFALILLLPSLWATASLVPLESFSQSESFLVNDYLIHYGSGFVRRGLFGSLLLQLLDAGIPINPSALSLGLSLAALWLTGLLVALGTLQLSRLNALLIAFSPALLPMFHALDPLGAGRKDALSLLTIAAGLLLFETLRGRRRRLAIRLILVVLLPLLTLCHESSLFFIAIPLCALDLLSQGDRSGGPLRSDLGSLALALIPTLLCLVAIASSPDLSASQIRELCQAWADRGLAIRCDPLPGYFGALRNHGFHRRMAQSAFLAPRFYLTLLLTLAYLTLMLRGPLLQLAVLHGSKRTAEGHRQNEVMPCWLWPATAPPQSMAAEQLEGLRQTQRSLAITRATLLAAALIAFVPSLPVYGLACDFGRWLSIAFTILVLQLCSSRYMAALERALRPARGPLLRLDTLLPAISPSWASLWLVIATPWLRLPHFATPPLLLTPNLSRLRSLWSWLLP